MTSSGTDDLAARRRALATGRDPASGRWQEETRRLRRTLEELTGGASTRRGDSAAKPFPGDLAAAVVVGLAFPERLARRRRDGGRTYLMASGTAAELAEGTSLAGSSWLAVAVADRPAWAPRRARALRDPPGRG